MRVLVCGSRTFNDGRLVDGVLDSLDYEDEIDWIIEGGAAGADTLGGSWADRGGKGSWTFKADWEEYGRSAGPIRNQRMLDESKPDLVVAFVDKPLAESKGTAHMVGIARQAGVKTIVVEVQ